MADTTLTLILRLRDETAGALTRLKAEVDALHRSTNKNFAAMQARGTDAAKSIGQIATSANVAAQKLEAAGRAVGTIAVAFTGIQTVQWLKGFADAAARAEVLNTVLKTVAVNSGVTEAYISKLDRTVQGLGITAAASRQSLTTFLQAGLDIAKAGQLARAAQDLAVIAGSDSSQVFARMITNIQQLDTVGLRWMGIIVSQEEAAAKYAATLGKTADELTRAERQQGLMNAVLEKSIPLTGVYEKAMGDVGKQLTSLTRLQNDVARNIGNVLLPTYSMLVEEFTTFLKNIGVMTEAYSANQEGAQELRKSLLPIVSAFRSLAEFVVKNIEVIAILIKYFIYFRVFVGVLNQGAQAANLFGEAFAFVGKAINFFKPATIAANLLYLRSVFQMIAVTITTAVIPAIQAMTLALMRSPVGLALTAIGAILAGAYLLKLRSDAQMDEAEKKRTKSVEDQAERRKLALAAEDGAQAESVARRAYNYKRLQAMTEQSLRDNEEDMEITRQINEARKFGTKEEFDIAKKRMEEFKKAAAERKKERAELLSTENVTPQQEAELEAAAKRQKAYLENAKAVDELKTAMTELGVESQSTARALDIPKDFLKTMGQADTILNGYFKQLRDGAKDTDALATSFNQASAAVEQLVEKANTFDALQAAMKRVAQLTKEVSSARLDALFDTASVKSQEALIADLNKVLYGYITRTKEAAEATALLRQSAFDQQKYVSDIRLMIAEFGAGMTVAENGIISINKTVRTFTDNRSTMNRLEQEQINKSIFLAQQKYDAEEKQTKDLLYQRTLLLDSERNLRTARANEEARNVENKRLDAIREENRLNYRALEDTSTLVDHIRNNSENLTRSTDENIVSISQLIQAVQKAQDQIESGAKNQGILNTSGYDAFNAAKIAADRAANDFEVAEKKVEDFAITARFAAEVFEQVKGQSSQAFDNEIYTLETDLSTISFSLEEIRQKSKAIAEETAKFPVSKPPTTQVFDEEKRDKARSDALLQIQKDFVLKQQAIDYDANQKRLENARTLYGELEKLQQQQQAKLRDSTSRIAELTKELANVTKSQTEYKFEQRLKEMSDYEQRLERQAQLEKTIQTSREAAYAKNSELARSSASEAVTMAKTLVDTATTELERKDALEEVEEAYTNQKTILTELRAEEEKAQAKQAETLNMLATAMDGLREKFNILTEARKVQLKVEFLGQSEGVDAVTDLQNRLNEMKRVDLLLSVNEENLKTVRAQIQAGLKDIDISAKVSVTSYGSTGVTNATPPKVALGGKVSMVGDKAYIQRFAQGGKVVNNTMNQWGGARITNQGNVSTVNYANDLRRFASGGKVVNTNNTANTNNTSPQSSATQVHGNVYSVLGTVYPHGISNERLEFPHSIAPYPYLQKFAEGGKVAGVDQVFSSQNLWYDQRNTIDGRITKPFSPETNILQKFAIGGKLYSNVSDVRSASNVVSMLVNKYATGGSVTNKTAGNNVVSLMEVRNLLRTIAGPPPQKFAMGGLPISSTGRISGPGTGTSDNIPIMVSNGEWIIREKAVKFYGDAFLAKLNNLELPKASLPRYATGGKVVSNNTSSPVAFPTIGKAPMTGGSPIEDRVTVDINIGGEQTSLFGERQQVDRFVKALRRTG